MEAVEIAADRVEWSAGVARAEGAVEVHIGEQVLVGTRATWDGVTLVVEAGEYRRPDGTFAFDRAELRPREGTGVVVAARVETGGAVVSAATLTVGERWEATHATVAPCACDDRGAPAVTFRAARITVVPDEVVILHGGVVRVFTVPILPVPYWRVPLDPHRFRLLLPELGWGEYGAAAKIEGRGGVGDWYVQGGPAWRQDVGVRGEVAVTGPGGVRAEGGFGWDAEVSRVRGAGATRGGFDGAVRVGWDTAYVSDGTYLDDYAVDYVARGVGWRDSRAGIALLSGDIALDGWLPDDGSAGALGRARVQHTFGRGAARVTPRLGVELAGALGGAVTPVAEVGAAGAVAAGLPWLQVDARGDLAGRAAVGEGGLLADLPGFEAALPEGTPGETLWAEGLASAPLARWGAGATGVTAAASANVALPVWSTLGAARLQWWPGLRAETRLVQPLDGPVEAAVRAGPGARVATGFAAGTLGLDAAVLYDGAAWRPAGALDVTAGGVGLRVQADPDVVTGELRLAPSGPVSVTAGGTRAGTLAFAWGDTSLAFGRLRAGAGLAWDIGGGALSGADARLGYDDGCAAATLTARFSPDRVAPDIGFAATVRR